MVSGPAAGSWGSSRRASQPLSSSEATAANSAGSASAQGQGNSFRLRAISHWTPMLRS